MDLVPLLVGCLLAALGSSSYGCPTGQNLRQLCKCQPNVNGILLDCSSSPDGLQTLRLLKDNQAQLGLIQELLMQNGTLRSLPDGSFDGLYVKKLDLSGNELENVSSQAFRGLENVLQILILSKNNLRRLPAEAIKNMAALAQLDLSNNVLEDLQDADAIRNTPKLYDLNLANNRICNLHKEVFDDLKRSMQTLNLGGNCFDKVPAAAVRGFNQLLALHLHNNKIQQLEPLQFMNLPTLSLLNLAQNRIAALHRQAFLNVPNLRFVYLSDNNISRLDANDFRTFANLELLDLTRNQLKTVPSSAFTAMPRLSQLYLGENDISQIEPGAFNNSNLVILLMPNNRIEQLRPDMFSGLTYLQQFSLKGNRIKKIAANTFHQMPSLVVVDLSDNQLASLEPATFLAQLNLFLLDLSHNKFASTPYNAFNQRIVTVVLQENPLVCTERVHALQNGVAVNIPGVVDAVCGGVTAKPTKQPEVSGPELPAFVQGVPDPVVQPPIVPGLPVVTNGAKGGLQSGGRAPVITAITIKPIQPGPTHPPSVQVRPSSRHPVINPVVPAGQPAPPGFILPPEIPSETPNPQIWATASFAVPGTSGVGVWPPTPGVSSSFVPGIVEPVPLPDGGGNEQIEQPETQEIDSFPTQPVDNRQPEQPQWAWTWPTALVSSGPAAEPSTAEPPPPTINLANINPPPAFVASPDLAETTSEIPAPPTSPSSPQSSAVPALVPAPAPVPSTPSVDPTWKTELWITRRPTAPWQVSPASEGGDSQTPGFTRTVPTKKPSNIGASNAVNGEPDGGNDAANASANATTTIAVCLTVVVVVLISVFITLCVIKHRNSTKRSLSSESRTSAYVAAQTARMNYAASTYGMSGVGGGTSAYVHNPQRTLPRPNVVGGTLSKTSTVNNQAWIYAPGTYAPSSAYYK